MLITQKTFTEVALKLVEPGKAYDREFLAKDVAGAIAEQLYAELGRTKSMSMLDLSCLKAAFFTAAMSLIDWTRCNQKVEPREYADSLEYNAWPQPIKPEEVL